MNLILLEPEELQPDGRAVVRDRRAQHILTVHQAKAGDSLRVGVIGGSMGEGTVAHVAANEVEFLVRLGQPPPAPLEIDLLLALPRPKILKKVIPAATSMGVKRIVLVNAARVEKSYFTSPLLQPEAMRELLLLGLEQARDTAVPEVMIRQRFRPFVEDEVEGLWPAPTTRLLAHPMSPAPLEAVQGFASGHRSVVAIGPEGGWVPFEVELLQKQGFLGFSLGPRILRVDTAVSAILAQLDLMRRLAREVR